ncbi:MAG: adenylate/guanylate cyclase domain-containing protein [Anaerolineales bacterium]
MADERSNEAEFRLVTILFADIVGSTAMLERTDAETMRLALDRCLRIMSQSVDRFGGTVARLAGDGLLAFFGAPKAHEDDPERAALAALEMHEAIQHYGQELNQDLSIRVGINTGRVIMGDVGGEIKSEYTAMGEPIHFAARLESAAEPGTTLVGETTCRLIRHRFETSATEPRVFKGFDQPQVAYRLVGALPEPQSERGRSGGASTPFVGRSREMDDLSRLVDELTRGRGAIAALIGEPGVGKSRLLHELRQLQAEADVTWAEGRAYSYTQDQPHGVIRDLLHELLGLSADDTPAMTDLKLERALMPLFEGESSTVWPFLAALLGAPQPPSSEQSLDDLDPETLAGKMTEAFVHTIEAMAAQKPLVLSFDDLHWADPSSLEWIQALFLSTERVPLALILMFRPETDKKVWDLKASAERDFGHRFLPMRLQPLNPAETDTLIQGLLSSDSGQQDLISDVRERAEGNPFYVEELVRALVEPVPATDLTKASPRGSTDLTVPETVQEVVQARIDRLPQGDRAALQAAAVIGRRFAFPVLEAMIAPQNSLEEKILHLQRADLIRERARIPHPEYIFKHSIVHELTYHSVVAEQRKRLHERAGEILEQLYSDRLADHASVIAHHYLEGGNDPKALEFERLAAESAYRVFANLEAAEHYEKAVAVARRLHIHGDELIQLWLHAGRARELSSDYDGADRTYREMAETAKQADDREMLLAANMARITIMVTPTQLMNGDAARQLIDESMALAQSLNDRAAESSLFWSMGLLARFEGNAENAVEYGEKSLQIARELGLVEQSGFTLTDLFWGYLAVGDFERARQTIEQAEETWQALVNLPMYTDSLSSSVALHFLVGDYQASLEAARRAWEISTEIDNLWGKSFSRLFAPMTLLDLGETGRALAQMQESLDLAVEAGFWIPQVFVPAVMAATYGHMGQPERGQQILQDAPSEVPGSAPFGPEFLTTVNAYLQVLAGERAPSDPVPLPMFDTGSFTTLLAAVWPTLQVEAGLVAYHSGYEAMEALATRRVDMARGDNTPTHLIEALLVLGEAELSLEKTRAAADRFEEAIELADRIGHKRLCWQILKGLAEAQTILDEPEAADRTHARAREEIEYIADRAGSEELRQSFLKRPEVRQVMDMDESP